MSRDGDEKRIEPQVNALLKLLLDHAGESVSRDTINSRIWSDRVVGDDALRAMVRKLREALGDNARNPHYIRTEPLKGYALIAPVSPVPASKSDRATPFQRRSIIALAGVSTLAVAAAVFLIRSLPDEKQAVHIEQLTSMRGSEVSPDFSAASHRLLFSHRANKDDFLQLYVKDLNNGQVQRLTWDAADYANALWSPDGRQIIYTRSNGSDLRHFIAGFDAAKGIVGEKALLPNNQSKRYLLAWSMTGKAVYLKDSAQPGVPAGVSRLDLNSGKLTSITAPSVLGRGDFFARESWNGKMLAVLREVERGKKELLILDRATGSLLRTRILNRPADRFAWAQDDSSLTLTSFLGGMQTFDLDADQLKVRAVPAPGINDIFYQCGKDCLYMRQHNGNFLDLQEQPNPFLERPLMASRNLDLPGSEDLPIFGHDGEEVFFVEKLEAGIAIKHKSADSTVALAQLPTDSKMDSLQLSPDGTHLAGLLNGRVFVLAIQHPEMQFLTGGADPVGFPFWSPDGNGLLFAKMEKGTPTLYRYSVDSGDSELVMRNYIAVVPVDKQRSIRLDTQNNAWLFLGEQKLRKLIQLPSASPNRWQIRGDWLYFTAHEGNLAVMQRLNLKTGTLERRELAKNRFRLNFDLPPTAERMLAVKSLLAESNLVKVSLQ
ncbi:winged helix-turn-helix domain-containing protein [Microbulbifer hainanensis]|uniref:winged helix-turn-helix domain-containing protein n=1 Tax=Microbulbifer hainanensis TaxID=2735675 RepID=UPI001868F100|nr:winged helix-turn-helix domain-containing protein [Microbulbifer hainanensis]